MYEDATLGRIYEYAWHCIARDGRTIVRTHGPLSIIA